jgi:hypothetical protein
MDAPSSTHRSATTWVQAPVHTRAAVGPAVKAIWSPIVAGGVMMCNKQCRDDNEDMRLSVYNAVVPPTRFNQAKPIGTVVRMLERRIWQPHVEECIQELRSFVHTHDICWLDARVLHRHYSCKDGAMVELMAGDITSPSLVTANCTVVPDAAAPFCFTRDATTGCWQGFEFTVDPFPVSLWQDGTLARAFSDGVFDEFHRITAKFGLENFIMPAITRRDWFKHAIESTGEIPGKDVIMMERSNDHSIGSVVTVECFPSRPAMPDGQLTAGTGEFRTSWSLHECGARCVCHCHQCCRAHCTHCHNHCGSHCIAGCDDFESGTNEVN